MQPADMQRKLRQLDNDVQSIYELLASISAQQGRHLNRLEELDAKLDGMDAKLGGMDAKLGGMDAKLGGMDGKLDAIVGVLGNESAG